MGFDFSDEVRNIHRKGAVDDDDIRIKNIQEVVHADGNILDKLLGHGGGIRIPGRMSRDKGIDVCGGDFFELRVIVQDRALGGILFEAPLVAARTVPAVRFDDRMAEFACVSIKAGIQFVVDYDTYSDAGMDADADHVRHVIAERFFAEDGKIRLIFQRDGNMEKGLEFFRKREVLIIVIGRKGDLIFMDDAVNAKTDADNAEQSGGQAADRLRDQPDDAVDDTVARMVVFILLQAAIIAF